jgi:hypothetical protein
MLYRSMARNFNAPPPVVDEMELWQVVACLVPDPRPDVEVETRPGIPSRANGVGAPRPVTAISVVRPGEKPLREIDVIKARLAAHAAGLPEPTYLHGERV